MFDTVKGYIAAGLVGIVILLGVAVWFLNKETHTQDKEIVTQKVENDSLKDAAKKDEASDKNSDESTSDLVKKNDDVKEKGSNTLDKVNEQRQRVEKKYQDLPKTVENTDAKINEKSQLILDTLWNQYCENYPTHETCIAMKGVVK